MKRVSLVLAGLVVLGLSACKGGAESTEGTTDSAATTVEAPVAPVVDSAAVAADTTAKVDSAAAVK